MLLQDSCFCLWVRLWKYNLTCMLKRPWKLYLLTPWSRVLLEKLNASAASQEIPRIFGTQKFLTVLTSASHLSLSWANSIRSPQSPKIIVKIFPYVLVIEGYERSITLLLICSHPAMLHCVWGQNLRLGCKAPLRLSYFNEIWNFLHELVKGLYRI